MTKTVQIKIGSFATQIYLTMKQLGFKDGENPPEESIETRVAEWVVQNLEIIVR